MGGPTGPRGPFGEVKGTPAANPGGVEASGRACIRLRTASARPPRRLKVAAATGIWGQPPRSASAGDATEPHTGRFKLGAHVARMPADQAGRLAAALMAAANGGHLALTVACPLCGEGFLTILYDPGDPGVRTFPNGDPGYPGTPAFIAELAATCGCWTEERQAAIFHGIDYETWLCECEVSAVAGTTVRDPEALGGWAHKCLTTVRVGSKCPNCGCVEPEGARHQTATDEHPVYTMLEEIVGRLKGIAEWYAEDEMARFSEEIEEAADDTFAKGGRNACR